MGAKSTNATSLAHEAYSSHILFEERDGFWWLRGEDLIRAKKVLGLDCNGSAAGFDAATVSEYASLFSKKGMKVGLLRGNVIQTIEFHRPKKLCQVPSTTIGLAPELLMDKDELVILASSKRMNSPAMLEQIIVLKDLLQRNAPAELSAYGTLYVFQVAEDMYEIDDELTTVPKEALDALLVAAYQMGRMLRCQLVEPRGRRQHGRFSNKPSLLTVSQPGAYGQWSLPF